MNNIQELTLFNHACDEFISGKYILADIKIASILNIIAEDEKISNIISNCLKENDFSSEINKFIREDLLFSVPNDDKAIVSFVYTLLYKFKNGDIDFYQFLTKYYNTDNGKDFSEFAKTIIEPFKNAINTIFSKLHVLVEADDYQTNYYNKIMTTVKFILKNIDNYKLKMNEKEEFTLLLNSLYLASEKNDKKLVFSLMIGIDYFTKCNRKCRIAYLFLEECFEKS